MSASNAPRHHAFASDNTAGICPEAWAALAATNRDYVASYGEDEVTTEARRSFNDLFETECSVFFVFNGTAANALALSACCRDPFTSILCHAISHLDTDECGAPEFFTGGAKLIPLSGADGKLSPHEVERILRREPNVHFPKPRVLSLTQSTEWATVYSREEISALAQLARTHDLRVHMDGARFANAVAALAQRDSSASALRALPADVTWRAGVDVLTLGGTKNGLLGTEAVVFFNRALAQDFEYRVKQGGQLASKMRFAAAQWSALLRDGVWLKHAAHANAQAKVLAEALRPIPKIKLIRQPEVNAVFAELAPAVYPALAALGWRLNRFVGEHGYRLMCSWSTTAEDIDELIADIRSVVTSIS
ncbi:MAG: low specificity L-threonine aldolase [Opitutus sp.]